MPETSKDAEVRLAEQAWNECISRRQAQAAKEFMADDYLLVGVRSTGAVPVGRTEWLEGLEEMNIHQYEVEITRIRVYGDSAVVSLKGSWTIDFRGRRIDENFYLTDVWVKQAERWRVVLRHSSPYPRQS